MISQRLRGFYTLFTGYQIFLSQIVFWLHFYFISYFYSSVPSTLHYLIYSFLVVVSLSLEAGTRTVSDADWSEKSVLEKHKVAVRQSIFAAAGVVFFLAATKDQFISRTFLFTYFGLLYVCLLFSMQVLPKFLLNIAFRGARYERTLLIGQPDKIDSFRAWLSRKTLLRFEVVGFLSDKKPTPTSSILHLGDFSDLNALTQQKKINQVILVELPADSSVLSDLISRCEMLGVRLLVVSNLQEKFRHKIVHMEHDGIHIIALREEPLENPFSRATKRLLDFAVALPIVVFCLPIACLVVWILQRLQSPGALFFIQERSGFQNRPFRIIKFRTMHLNKDGARQATVGDDRIFSAGRWMRKYSIDELPQFLNVVAGHMTVVGPRPHLQEHNEKFSRILNSYHIRGLVKPGITGLAQVRGFRGEAINDFSLQKRIESDIYYLENWSFGADVVIIFRTIWQMLRPPKSAY